MATFVLEAWHARAVALSALDGRGIAGGNPLVNASSSAPYTKATHLYIYGLRAVCKAARAVPKAMPGRFNRQAYMTLFQTRFATQQREWLGRAMTGLCVAHGGEGGVAGDISPDVSRIKDSTVTSICYMCVIFTTFTVNAGSVIADTQYGDYGAITRWWQSKPRKSGCT